MLFLFIYFYLYITLTFWKVNLKNILQFRSWDTDVLVLTLAEEAIAVAHASANRWTGSTFYAFFPPFFPRMEFYLRG